MGLRDITSEKTIEHKLVEGVTNLDGLCLKLLSQQHKGLPDRLCIFPGGRVCFVEVKTTGQKPKPIQNIMLNRLAQLGAEVYVVDSVEKVNNLLNLYKK